MREHGRGGSGTTLAGPHRVGAIPTGSARLGLHRTCRPSSLGRMLVPAFEKRNLLDPIFTVSLSWQAIKKWVSRAQATSGLSNDP